MKEGGDEKNEMKAKSSVKPLLKTQKSTSQVLRQDLCVSSKGDNDEARGQIQIYFVLCK
jgi:hypothetical protein